MIIVDRLGCSSETPYARFRNSEGHTGVWATIDIDGETEKFYRYDRFIDVSVGEPNDLDRRQIVV